MALLPTLGLLVQREGDVSALLNVGDRAPSRPVVERDFVEPVVIPGLGHDGQQFYVIARAIPALETAAGHVDRVRYRARRILFPLAVAPFPAGPPTVWAMVSVNLLAVGLTAVGLGRLASRVGLSPLLGTFAGLSPALLVSTRATLADASAFALALWGLVLWRRRPWWAALLLALAALAREHTLVVPLVCGAVALSSKGQGRTAAPLLPLAVPFAVYATWSGLVALWLPDYGSEAGAGPVTDTLALLDPPFRPWLEIGLAHPTVVFGAVLVAGSVVAAAVLRARFPELALWLLADAALLLLSTPEVSAQPLNYSRAAPLAVPALAMALAWRRVRPAPPNPLSSSSDLSGVSSSSG